MRSQRTNNAKITYYEARLAAGLQDVGGEDGQELPLWYRFQNWRPGPDGSIQRRGGMQRFSRIARAESSPDLNGSTHFATVNRDTRVHTLRRYWTFEALCKPDTFTAERCVWDTDHASDYSLRGPYFKTDGKVEAKTQDSAGTVTTLTSATTFSTGTPCAIQVVRNGTAVTLRVNGATEATGTMADLDGKAPGGNQLIGKNQAGAFFDGVIDFVRCMGVVLPDQRYGFIRFPYPRAEPVLWAYEMEDQGGFVYDRSRYENHAVTVDFSGTLSPSNNLCASSMPVFGIAEWLSRDAKPTTFVAAGSGYVLQEVVK